MWGEYTSAESINAVLADFVPKPVAKGEYYDDTNTYVAFYSKNFLHLFTFDLVFRKRIQ
jgi:hypothetical protein